MTASAWPPAEGLTTVNVPRQDAILITTASIRINAPAALVLETLRHVKAYGEWNSWCPNVTIHSQPQEVKSEQAEQLNLGTSFTLHVIMDASKPSKTTPTQLKITDLSTPDAPSSYVPKDLLEEEAAFTADLSKVYRIAWKCEGGFVARGLKTERFHEIIVLGANECEVRTWEMQGGVLAHTVKWLYRKTLDQKFVLWCEDLKKRCEAQASKS